MKTALNVMFWMLVCVAVIGLIWAVYHVGTSIVYPIWNDIRSHKSSPGGW